MFEIPYDGEEKWSCFDAKCITPFRIETKIYFFYPLSSVSFMIFYKCRWSRLIQFSIHSLNPQALAVQTFSIGPFHCRTRRMNLPSRLVLALAQAATELLTPLRHHHFHRQTCYSVHMELAWCSSGVLLK